MKNLLFLLAVTVSTAQARKVYSFETSDPEIISTILESLPQTPEDKAAKLLMPLQKFAKIHDLTDWDVSGNIHQIVSEMNSFEETKSEPKKMSCFGDRTFNAEEKKDGNALEYWKIGRDNGRKYRSHAGLFIRCVVTTEKDGNEIISFSFD